MSFRINTKIALKVGAGLLASGVGVASLSGCAPEDLSKIPGPIKDTWSSFVPPSPVSSRDVTNQRKVLTDNCRFLKTYSDAQPYECTQAASDNLDIKLMLMTPEDGLKEVIKRDENVAQAIVQTFPADNKYSWCSNADKLVDKDNEQDATSLSNAAKVGYGAQEEQASTSIKDRFQGYWRSCEVG